jgi:hypothetical protein
MTALLHAELLKLRTTRTLVALAGAALALSLLLVALSASTQAYTRHPVDLHTLFTADFTGVCILLLGAIGRPASGATAPSRAPSSPHPPAYACSLRRPWPTRSPASSSRSP